MEVQVDLLEPDEAKEPKEPTGATSLSLLQKHFDLRLGGQGLIKGSRRVLANDTLPEFEEFEEPEAIDITKARRLYDGIVLMKPFGSDLMEIKIDEMMKNLEKSSNSNVSENSNLWNLHEDGLLLVESTSSDREALQRLGDVLELNDLLQV